jgi:hypothetical protein
MDTDEVQFARMARKIQELENRLVVEKKKHEAELKGTVSIREIIKRGERGVEDMKSFRQRVTDDWRSTVAGFNMGNGPVDVRSRNKLYKQRVMHAQRLVAEYEFVATDIVELYTAAYIKLLGHYDGPRTWGAIAWNPDWNQTMDRQRDSLGLMIFNEGRGHDNTIQRSLLSYAGLFEGMRDNIVNLHTVLAPREPGMGSLTDNSRSKTEMKLSFREAMATLVDTFFSRKIDYRDMELILQNCHLNWFTNDADFDVSMTSIFNRIVHKITQREKDLSDEVSFWRHILFTRLALQDKLPPELRERVFEDVRREQDQGTRSHNTYIDYRAARR